MLVTNNRCVVLCLLIGQGNTFMLPSDGLANKSIRYQQFALSDDFLDDPGLQESLESMRNSVNSIQESIQTTRNALDATHLTISKATLPSTELIGDKPDMSAASRLFNEAMTEVKSSHYAGYLHTSLGSIRESLYSIQSSIQEVKEVHGMSSEATVHSMIYSFPSGPVDPGKESLLTNYLVGKTGIQSSVEAMGQTGGDFIKSNTPHFDALKSATLEYHSNLQNDLGKFLENTSAETNAIAVDAKIKLSMMVSNTFMVLGLDPPEGLARSSSFIPSSRGLLVALLAGMMAVASKELAENETKKQFKILLQNYAQQLVSLKSQSGPMKEEIEVLTGQIEGLKKDIHNINLIVTRFEFKEGLERDYWATKLRAKRRRLHRMRTSFESKNAIAEGKELNLLETKYHNMHALRVLSEKKKLLFDDRIEIVDHAHSMVPDEGCAFEATVHHKHRTNAHKESSVVEVPMTSPHFAAAQSRQL